MKKVYSSKDIMFLGHLRNLLENEGIFCEILRDHLLGTLGGVPPVECWAELWITDDRQFERALNIINRSRQLSVGAQQGDCWNCKSCGEDVEIQFMACWNCGSYNN